MDRDDWKRPTWWLERLSFSLLAVGAVLAWHGYRTMSETRGAENPAYLAICFVGAALCIAAGVVGIGRRHRSEG